MKSFLMQIDSCQVLVKVYLKSNDEDLREVVVGLTYLWRVLSKFPSILPYQLWMKSPSAKPKAPSYPIYLIRQYLNASLHDRLSTRPFLIDVERFWLVFQLLKCIEICHEHGIVHGDLKPENILCTTSHWLVLTDFGSFKPALIPEDDPTDFQYYFDAMNRHRCYLAPERFSSTRRNIGSAKHNFKSNDTLQSTMDVFSLGCIIAEVYFYAFSFLSITCSLIEFFLDFP